MSDLIIAVKSHFGAMEMGAHDAIRGTWGNALRARGIQTKFFMGRPTQDIGGALKSVNPTWQNSYSPKNDEVILDCPDDYQGLVWKTRGICQWMMDRKADHILLLDNDCVVYPKKLFNSNYQIADYSGTFNGGYGNVGPREIAGQLVPECYSWASGAGYFLSKKAAMLVADKTPMQARYIAGSAEDFWVGQILGPLAAKGDILSMPLEERVTEYYLVDGHSKGYDPKSRWMEQKWEAYLKG